MDTWVKVVLGAAAAYVAYEFFLAPSTVATSTVPASWTAAGGTAAQWAALSSAQQATWNSLAASAQTATEITTLESAAPVVTSTAPNQAAAIQALAANDANLSGGMLLPSQWNFYANTVTGKTIPASWPASLTTPVSFATYWGYAGPVVNAMTGVSGLGEIMQGLGAVSRAHGGRWPRHGMGDYVSPSTDPATLMGSGRPDWN